MMPEDPQPTPPPLEHIWAASFVSHRTRKGMVQLNKDEVEIAQLPVDKARELATHILRAAEAAETDEMCLALLDNNVGLSLINLFRRYRETKLGLETAQWTPEEIIKGIKALAKV